MAATQFASYLWKHFSMNIVIVNLNTTGPVVTVEIQGRACQTSPSGNVVQDTVIDERDDTVGSGCSVAVKNHHLGMSHNGMYIGRECHLLKEDPGVRHVDMTMVDDDLELFE